MLSVGANATAFSATAYAAEPIFEEDTGKTEEQFEDEEHPETADRLETAEQPEAADQATNAAETVKHPEAADRPEDEEASGSAAQETKDAEGRPVTGEKPETTAQQTTAEQPEAVPAAEATATANAPASSSEEEHHLAFASDYHNTEGSIRNAMEGLPEDVEYVSLICREARENESCRKKRS